jgi:hypothetical protein
MSLSSALKIMRILCPLLISAVISAVLQSYLYFGWVIVPELYIIWGIAYTIVALAVYPGGIFGNIMEQSEAELDITRYISQRSISIFAIVLSVSYLIINVVFLYTSLGATPAPIIVWLITVLTSVLFCAFMATFIYFMIYLSSISGIHNTPHFSELIAAGTLTTFQIYRLDYDVRDRLANPQIRALLKDKKLTVEDVKNLSEDQEQLITDPVIVELIRNNQLSREDILQLRDDHVQALRNRKIRTLFATGQITLREALITRVELKRFKTENTIKGCYRKPALIKLYRLQREPNYQPTWRTLRDILLCDFLKYTHHFPYIIVKNKRIEIRGDNIYLLLEACGRLARGGFDHVLNFLTIKDVAKIWMAKLTATPAALSAPTHQPETSTAFSARTPTTKLGSFPTQKYLRRLSAHPYLSNSVARAPRTH